MNALFDVLMACALVLLCLALMSLSVALAFVAWSLVP